VLLAADAEMKGDIFSVKMDQLGWKPVLLYIHPKFNQILQREI
jgi:hypothetical protein